MQTSGQFRYTLCNDIVIIKYVYINWTTSFKSRLTSSPQASFSVLLLFFIILPLREYIEICREYIEYWLYLTDRLIDLPTYRCPLVRSMQITKWTPHDGDNFVSRRRQTLSRPNLIRLRFKLSQSKALRRVFLSNLHIVV